MPAASVGAIVQARMGSSRLPGKVLKRIGEDSLLGIIFRRLARSETVDEVVLATSNSEQDDPIVALAQERNWPYYRGPEDDVLRRYVEAAAAFDVSVVVRVCADNPLTSPVFMDRLVREYRRVDPDYAYTTNVPYGCKLRVVDSELLRDLSQRDLTDRDREHVTLYLDQNPEKFDVHEVDFGMDTDLRLTVDVPEDLHMMRELNSHIGPLADVSVEEATVYLQNHDDLRLLNESVGTEFSANDDSRPAISVITRTYNSAQYVERAIDSVRDQTFDLDRVEHVVIDDGSADRTPEIIRSYGEDVRFIETDHTGAIHTLNTGIRESRGKYVVSLDADDYFEPEILGRMYRVLENDLDVAFVYSDYFEETIDGERVYRDTADDIFNTILIGIMFRKEALYRVGLYDEELNFPEYDLLMKLRQEGLDGHHISDGLFTYYRHSESMTADEKRIREGKRQLKEKYGEDMEFREY